MKIIVLGGAGYVGSVLLPFLLEAGHEVTVYDNLMFGGNHLIPFFKYPNFHFVKADILDIETLKKHVKDKDVVVHLAAIVGFPACRKDPLLAQSVNVDGTKNLISCVQNQLVIYASTGSNYGSVDDVCTEDTPLNPLSLYGTSKTTAETLLLQQVENAVIFRFSTAFGISPRLRLDLLINDFTHKCVTQGYLVVYEKEFKRSFVHVSDMARAIVFAIENRDKMIKNAYNVGHESMNYTKEQICDIIASKTKAYIHYATIGEDQDKRNYEVSYEKIRNLGFNTTVTIEQGIGELIKAIDVINNVSPYHNA